jgi:D-inositol-3-phosphate glycosyltransferase
MIRRVAYLTVHTSPLAQPGVGEAGGMNVYLDELARTLADRGVQVEVFTRATSAGWPAEVELRPGYRVVHILAGPRRRLSIPRLAGWVDTFADGVVNWAHEHGSSYDVVHSHYWLSGWAGVMVKKALGIPLANSFHTLGRVKEAHRRPDEPPESLLRIAAEKEVIERSDCLVASTPAESEDLLQRYGADPAKLCVSPPGVDHELFRPGPRGEARRFLGLGEQPLLLFIGRIQPSKGVDVAVGALRILAEQIPEVGMLVVGGPSGPRGSGELTRMRERISKAGLAGRVRFLAPQPHRSLPVFYQAADVLLVPSRTESFGLVAVEAQACGLPVVAAKVGGLSYAVDHGRSGLLVEGHRPTDYAAAAGRIIADPHLARRLGDGGIRWAEDFSWQAAGQRMLELYEGMAGGG